MFDNIDEFSQIKSEVYKDIMRKIQPKILKVALSHNEAYFRKYCFFVLRKKLKQPENKNEGFMMTSVIMCLDKQTTDAELNKFYKEFGDKYAHSISDTKDFNLIQRYRLRQKIFVQYYTGQGKIDTKEVPEFYTSFADEGMTLNKSDKDDPTQVKHAFRYDQVIDCAGMPVSRLKKSIEPELAAHYKPDDCCVSYLTNWNGMGSKIMLCSTFDEMWKCKTEIKIIRSTMYDQCMKERMKIFFKTRERGKHMHLLKIGLIDRLGVLDTMHLMLDFDLKTYPNDNSPDYKIYEDQFVRNKEDFIINVKTLDYELAHPGEKSGGCQEYMDECNYFNNYFKLFRY